MSNKRSAVRRIEALEQREESEKITLELDGEVYTFRNEDELQRAWIAAVLDVSEHKEF